MKQAYWKKQEQISKNNLLLDFLNTHKNSFLSKTQLGQLKGGDGVGNQEDQDVGLG